MDTIPLWYVDPRWYHDENVQEPVTETSMDVMPNARVQFDAHHRPITIGYTHFYSVEDALEYLRDEVAENILKIQRNIAECENQMRRLNEDQANEQDKYTRIVARIQMIRAAVGFDDDMPTKRVRRLEQP
jgi:hypothetical protein